LKPVFLNPTLNFKKGLQQQRGNLTMLLVVMSTLQLIRLAPAFFLVALVMTLELLTHARI